MSEKREKPVLRQLANACTIARPIGAAAIAKEIVTKGPEFRSWKLATKTAGVLALDKADGVLARASGIESVYWAKMDQRLDKVTYEVLMYSMAIATGDPRYIGYTLTKGLRNAATETMRDALIARDRPAAARRLGQIKTTVEDVALVADISPLGDNHPGYVHTLHAASTGLALVSGSDILLNGAKELLIHARENLSSHGIILPNAA